MRNLVVKWFICLQAWIFSPLSFGVDYWVLAPMLVNRLSDTEMKQYNQLWYELQSFGGLPRIEVLPMKRLLVNFSDNPDVCIFPSDYSSINFALPESKDYDLIMGDVVDFISLRALTVNDSNVVNDYGVLKEQIIAMMHGLPKEMIFQEGEPQLVFELRHHESLIKILHSQRVDSIIAFTPDIHIAADKLGLPHPYNDPEFALIPRYGVSLLCHNTEANRELVVKFNEALQNLRTAGRLREILGPWAELD